MVKYKNQLIIAIHLRWIKAKLISKESSLLQRAEKDQDDYMEGIYILGKVLLSEYLL